MKSKTTPFDAQTIDNRAICIALDLLTPHLKYYPDLDYRVLDDQASDEQRLLYEQVFVPYVIESRKHHSVHHNFSIPDNWYGEQECLSAIYTINQRARWLLCSFAIKDSVRSHCKVRTNKLCDICLQATSCILDNNMSIGAAIRQCVGEPLDLDQKSLDSIINEVSETIEQYESAPAHPLVYR